MDKSVKKNIVIRPFSSKRGIVVLLVCTSIALLFAALSIFIIVIAPAGDAKARVLIMVLGIVSAIVLITGIILYFIFPRVKIIFDASRQEVIIKTGSNSYMVIPFTSLKPFQICEILRGYAHQYYCRNSSFGDFSDLFFSAYHERAIKKGKKLAALTGAELIDFNGKEAV